MLKDKIISLAEQQDVVRAPDVEKIGASRTLLPYLEKKGRLRRIAREALSEAIDQKKASRDEIWNYAQKCHMSRVLRPYLEMV